MSRSIIIGISGLVLIAVVAIGTAWWLNSHSSNSDQPGDTHTQSHKVSGGTNKLQSTDEVVGTGTQAVAGKKVTVHYTGTLEDGTKFDSSLDRGQPLSFNLGAGEVIQGWDQGVAGMKIGGKRKLVIPPELGYGSQSVGSIPPNSTLIFEIQLLNVE